MNYQQLSYFKTVYERGNITRAAEELHISQPAVSTAIRELEAGLGTPLFFRQNRGIVATEAGNVFYSLACRMLAQWENARRVVQEVAGQRMLVRIGMAPMAGSIVFPGIYRRLLRQCPQIELEIVEAGTHELVKRLQEEQVELILVPDVVEHPEFIRKEIYRSSLVFAIGAGHPLAREERLEPDSLDGLPLAVYQDGYVQNENVERFFREQGLTMSVMARLSNFVTMKTLIACGVCGGFLLKEVCEGEKGIRTFSFPQLPELPIHLIWKNDGYLSGAARQVIRCCEESINFNYG